MTHDEAKKAIQHLDSVAARVGGDRQSHQQLMELTKQVLEYMDALAAKVLEVAPEKTD